MVSQDLSILKNFGISSKIFDYASEEKKNDVYVIKQEKIKKNFSEGAILKIPGSISLFSSARAKDDMDLYGECDQEYGILGAEANEKYYYSFPNEFESNPGLIGQVGFDTATSRIKKDFGANKNFDGFMTNNFQSAQRRNINVWPNNTNSEYNNLKLSEYKEPNILDVLKETGSHLINDNINFNVNSISKNLNSNEYWVPNEKDKTENRKFTESNQNYFKNVAQIQSGKSAKPIDNNNLTKPNSEENLLFENGIFKDSMRNQMKQLDKLFQEMNETSEAKVIIKAYKSKMKTKFYKIYESNSEFYKEKNKYRLFHKCNFPGCSRTFASAGWLKIHFNEHLKEIQSNKFNVEFEKSLLKLKHMNLLK